jgi:hypothetical protein
VLLTEPLVAVQPHTEPTRTVFTQLLQSVCVTTSTRMGVVGRNQCVLNLGQQLFESITTCQRRTHLLQSKAKWPNACCLPCCLAGALPCLWGESTHSTSSTKLQVYRLTPLGARGAAAVYAWTRRPAPGAIAASLLWATAASLLWAAAASLLWQLQPQSCGQLQPQDHTRHPPPPNRPSCHPA